MSEPTDDEDVEEFENDLDDDIGDNDEIVDDEENNIPLDE